MSTKDWWPSKTAIGMLVAGIFLRSIWLWLFNVTPITDFHWYFKHAANLSQGVGYVAHGEPTAFWPVGYPLLLSIPFSIFGISVKVAQVTNLVFFCVAGYFLYLNARRWSNERGGCIALALFSLFHINQWAYVSLVSNELCFVAVLMAALWFSPFPSSLYRILAGILWGVCTLIKPQALLLPLVGLLSGFYGRPTFSFSRWLRLGLLMYIPLGLVIAPWLWRNYQVFERPVFVSTNGGINLYIGNHLGASGTFDLDEQHPDKKRINAQPDEPSRSDEAARLAKEYLKEHPLDALRRLPLKIGYLWYKDVEGLYWVQESLLGESHKKKTVLQGLKYGAQGVYVLLFVGMVWACMGLGLRHPAVGLLLGYGVYFTLLAMVFFGSTRFHFPVLPLGMICIGCMAFRPKMSDTCRE